MSGTSRRTSPAAPTTSSSTLRSRSSQAPMRERREFGGSSRTSRTRAPDFRLELERLELVGDQVLAFFKTHGSGRISGVPLDSENAVVYDFADDRIKRVRIFSDRQEALETLGMRE